MRRFARTLPVLTVLLAGASLARADPGPDAVKLLEKLQDAFDRPFAADITAEMSMEQMGQAMSLSMSGNTTVKDESHSRMSATTSIDAGGMQMQMTLLQISDGETVWVEMDSPMMGGKRVMKLDIDSTKEMMGGGMGAQGGAMDPVSQIRDLQDDYDFRLDSKSGGLVTLKGTMKESRRKDMLDGAAPGMSDALSDLTLVIEEKTGIPREMRMGEMVHVQLTDFRYLDKVDESLFSYTPPEGVPVMDPRMMGGGR